MQKTSNGRSYQGPQVERKTPEQVHTMTPQTTDPTLWKYPALYSPNRRIHIDNLEAKVAELEDVLKTYQLVDNLKSLEKCATKLHHAESQLEEARWLLENRATFTDSPTAEWKDRYTAWLSAHTPTGKEK